MSSLELISLDQAKAFANSDFVPKQYKGKPESVMLAIQMGKEIGLKPFQSLKNIAVINGMPAIWGDAAIALVMQHPDFENIDEKVENGIATCTVTRKGMTPHTVTFSVEDAKKAGLFGRPGPWQQYTNRMLQMRARGFALRDRFADALGGLILAEEAQDYPTETKDITPTTEHSTLSKSESLINKIAAQFEPQVIDNKQNLTDELLGLISSSEIDNAVDRMCDKLGVASILDMSADQLVKAIEWIKTKREKTS